MSTTSNTTAIEAASWICFHGATRADRERALAPHLPSHWNGRMMQLLHEMVEAGNVDTTQSAVAEKSPELGAYIVAAGVALWRDLPRPAQDRLIRDLLQAEAMAAG